MPTNLSNFATLQVRQMQEIAAYQSPGLFHGFASCLHPGWLSWQIVVSLLLVLVAYDQGKTNLLTFESVFWRLNIEPSHVHQAEGLNCRTVI
jgi:hypothetical protein